MLRAIPSYVLLLALLVIAGCGSEDPITSYRVPRIEQPISQVDSRPGEPQRTLGGVLNNKDQAWFFKLTGPAEAVALQEEAFHGLVKSISWNDADKPQWKNPPNWKQQAGQGMRYATVTIETEPKPLELSVIPLPKPPGEDEAYLLSNINRWRSQLQLPPIALNDLKNETQTIESQAGPVTVVNLAGIAGEDGMRPPFAGSAPFANPPRPAPPAEGPAQLTYEVPMGWREGESGGLRKAAFFVEKEGAKVETTVIDLSAAAGALFPNVNRWRGQVGLGDWSQEELVANTRKIKVGDSQADYVELAGPEETILGVVFLRGDKSWFVKLKGPNALAAQEKQRFEAFVKSLRFKP